MSEKLKRLQELDKMFGLVNLYQDGIILEKAITHKDIFEKYDTLIQQGRTTIEAKSITAKYFKANLRTVQRVVKEMK